MGDTLRKIEAWHAKESGVNMSRLCWTSWISDSLSLKDTKVIWKDMENRALAVCGIIFASCVLLRNCGTDILTMGSLDETQ
jgi:hypothetical protein